MDEIDRDEEQFHRYLRAGRIWAERQRRGARAAPDTATARPKAVCPDLSAKDSAAYMGWAYGTFRNNAKKKGIKKLRNGRYSIKELDKWKNYGRSEKQ